MQMIRQADPNRGIMLMAPDAYQDDIMEDAIEYGGDFHNTGYMAGWWCDLEPTLMRGARLPFSAEPGNGPKSVRELMVECGNWITEGVNGIDLFANIGEVLWTPDIKKCFEDHSKMYSSVGRYHSPVAQLAVLYSNRVGGLFGFPWVGPSTNDKHQPYFRGGPYVSSFNARALFSPMENIPASDTMYESDAVTEESFVHNRVGNYRMDGR